VIRTASDRDLVVLVDLEQAASSTGLAHIFGPDLPFPVDDVLARWRVVLDDPDVVTLLDEDESGPVGYAAYGDGWLRHFGYLPRCWGSGRADTLHDAVLAGLSAQGAPAAYLWVLVENQRARSFYARRGWCETGVREREVFEPYPEKMQMILAPGSRVEVPLR
jgi:GNAT superfamily N-acetyltransferase